MGRTRAGRSGDVDGETRTGGQATTGRTAAEEQIGMASSATATSYQDDTAALDGAGRADGEPVADGAIRAPSRLRLVDDVATALEDAILDGTLRPGERLIETRLCEELGISRTTLREAMLTLQRKGLVRNEPRRGTFVHRLSPDESMDLRRARSVLEGYVASAGYDHFGADDFAEMQALIDDMAGCEVPRDVARLIRLDLAFHGVIVRAMPSPVFHELWQSLNGRMSALILTSLERRRASQPDFAAFHQALLDALRTGDRAVMTEAVIAHYIGATPDDQQPLAEIALAITHMAMSHAQGRRGDNPHD
jgi:DNA-binding GntR family transcriptional regulator